MAIGAFAVTAQREAKISFSYTIISSAVSLLMKKPPDTTNYFQVILIFSYIFYTIIMFLVRHNILFKSDQRAKYFQINAHIILYYIRKPKYDFNICNFVVVGFL